MAPLFPYEGIKFLAGESSPVLSDLVDYLCAHPMNIRRSIEGAGMDLQNV
jgi:hypothetical protein